MTFQKVKKKIDILVSYEKVITRKQLCNTYLIRILNSASATYLYAK
jgi:hypothetical protein